VKSTLIDAGPIIALFDRSDRFHHQITQFLKEQSFHLVTTWPVLTEVSHLLVFDNRAQVAVLEWVYRGGLELFDVDLSAVRRIIDLTKKYDDVPMDLADATLVVAAEQLGIRDIISIDLDFYVYRTTDKEHINSIFRV
jgi:hypothetical protein